MALEENYEFGNWGGAFKLQSGAVIRLMVAVDNGDRTITAPEKAALLEQVAEVFTIQNGWKVDWSGIEE